MLFRSWSLCNIYIYSDTDHTSMHAHINKMNLKINPLNSSGICLSLELQRLDLHESDSPHPFEIPQSINLISMWNHMGEIERKLELGNRHSLIPRGHKPGNCCSLRPLFNPTLYLFSWMHFLRFQFSLSYITPGSRLDQNVKPCFAFSGFLTPQLPPSPVPRPRLVLD